MSHPSLAAPSPPRPSSLADAPYPPTTMADELGKRKREDGHEGRMSGPAPTPSLSLPSNHAQFSAQSIHRPGPLQATMDASSSSANSPLHSPTSSSSGHAAAVNGHGKKRGAEKSMRRNIDRVYFGTYDIKTWYYSPYPFDEDEWASMTDTGTTSLPTQRRVKSDGHTFSPGTPAHTPRDASLPRPGGVSSSTDRASTLQALEADAPLATRRDSQSGPAKALWVCDGCFKYMRTYGGYTVHKKDCKQTHPPGRKVYQRGAHIIWQVDGSREKLYAQNLSLFGKLFIDHKTIYFDVEPFTFYVLTDASSQFDHVLGFFSKEKVSYDDYNLACIITFPPFQKRGFGTLMIEFSYYLSSLSSVLGTPERPLSDLGFKGYLSYWSAVILRTLALFFHDQDPTISNCLLPASHALISPAKHKQSVQTAAANLALAEERQKKEVVRVRKTLLGFGPSKAEAAETVKGEESAGEEAQAGAARRGPKGWAGEMPRARVSRSASEDHRELRGEVKREPEESSSGAPMEVEAAGLDVAEVRPVPPRVMTPAPAHPLLQLDGGDEAVDLETTLDRLSSATNVRVDDVGFALSELGLLKLASKAGGEGPVIVITRDMVRQAIKRNRVKRPVLDVMYVLAV